MAMLKSHQHQRNEAVKARMHKILPATLLLRKIASISPLTMHQCLHHLRQTSGARSRVRLRTRLPLLQHPQPLAS
jgi:hypothetical protein